MPHYILDRGGKNLQGVHSTKRRKIPIEDIIFEYNKPVNTITTVYDTSIIQKELEQADYVFENLKEKAEERAESHPPDNDTQYNLDITSLQSLYIITEEQEEDLKSWKAGNVLTKEAEDVLGERLSGGIFTSLFPYAYNSGVSCQYIDSSEPEEEEDDVKIGDGSGGSGSGEDSSGPEFPPIVFPGGGKRRGKKN